MTDFREQYIPQPQNTIEEKIDHLSRMSGFKRDLPDTPNCTLERSGEKYISRVVENPNDPILEKAYDLLKATFKEAELDTFEDTKEYIKGMVDPALKETVRYRIIVITDQKGELMCVSSGMTIRLLDEDEKQTSEAVYFACYGAGKPGLGLKMMSLADEAFTSSLLDARAEAEAKKVNLIGVIAEGSTAGENEGILGGDAQGEAFANRMGLKRAFVGDKPVEYYQPAMKYDPKTGEVAKGAGDVLEHLEFLPFTAQFTKEQLIQTVRSVYYWNYYLERDNFDNNKAYKKHLKHVEKFYQIFEDSVNQQGELTLKTKAERKASK